MRAIFWTALIGFLASSALGGVSAHVYRADEVTPLAWADPNVPDVYEEIMVGTRLAVFISSDAPEWFWSGGTYMSWEDWDRGILAGRGDDEDPWENEGSILPASGEVAFVTGPLPNESGMRFTFSVDTALAGEWIVLDYVAQAVGAATVGLFSDDLDEDTLGDFDPDTYEFPPLANAIWIQGLTFNHVPSRDYDGDQVVNFSDFALLAGQWQGIVPADPNATASPDLDADEAVEIADLALFCEYWLDRTDVEQCDSEPNTPDIEP